MKITEIDIKNFGKLHQVRLRFYSGINVIYGENESGKSTMHHFLTGMMFGMEKQRGKSGRNDSYQQYEPWNSGSFYTGAMRFETGNKSFLLERNFYHKEKTARLVNERDGEELSVEYGDLEMLLGGLKKSTYENTYCIGQDNMETGKEFAGILQNYFVNASHTGDGDINLTGARKKLRMKEKELERRYRSEQKERESILSKLQLETDIVEKDVRQLENQLERLKKEGYVPEPSWMLTDDIPDENERNQMEEYLKEEREHREEMGYRRKREGFSAATVLLAAAFIIQAMGYSPVKGGWLLILLLVLLAAGILATVWYGRKEHILRLLRREEKQKEQAIIDPAEQKEKEARTRRQAVARTLNAQLMEKQASLSNLLAEKADYQQESPRELEIKQQTEACQLALRTLQDLSEHVYEDTREHLEGEISRILSSVSCGSYDRITLDEQMNLVACQGSRKLYPWQLSHGTMEQMYFALRLGAGRFFTQEESMPVLLDEVFSSFDETRLEETLRWLSRQPEQIFLFTCEKREMELLEKNQIPYGKIIMRNI